jgi:hypothetical protein
MFGVPCGGRGEIDASELTDFLSKHRNEKTGATPLGLVAIRHMQSDSLKGYDISGYIGDQRLTSICSKTNNKVPKQKQ